MGSCAKSLEPFIYKVMPPDQIQKPTKTSPSLRRRTVRKVQRSTTGSSLGSGVSVPWTQNTIPSKGRLSIPDFFQNGIQVRQLAVNSQRLQTPERTPAKHSQARLSFDSTKDQFYQDYKSKYFYVRKKQIQKLEPFLTSRKKTLNRAAEHTVSQPIPATPKKHCSFVARPPPKIEKISVKELIRDKDWVNKARPQILSSFTLMANKSNGVKMTPPSSNYFTYKYYLGPGNNAPLVKQIFATRWYWTRVYEDAKFEAHLVWTQGKDKEYLRELATLSDLSHELEVNQTFSVTTPNYIDQPLGSVKRAKLVDLSPLAYELISSSKSFAVLKQQNNFECEDMGMHNKLEGNFHNSNKKGLFYSLVAYFQAVQLDVFSIIPLTFHIILGENDPSFQEFENAYNHIAELGGTNMWILKPGENSNRGNGISVCENMQQIKRTLINNPFPSTGKHTYIIQRYIDNPFLIHRRKFDIRCFVMITCFNGVVQAYYYSEGYLRTASKIYSLSNCSNKFVHLTNDAVQKQSEDYGKFENGNKLSYNDFQKYLDTHYTERKVSFGEEIVPQIKKIVKDTIQAVYLKLDPLKRVHTFEIFGYDFLLDASLKPWLLEVNTNPCLETSSPILARIIPAMLENSFRIAVDPLFQEPTGSKRSSGLCGDGLVENKYELIFHSLVDGAQLCDQLGNSRKLLEESHPAIGEISDDEEELD